MKLSPKIYLFAVILIAIIVGFILTAPDNIFQKKTRKFNSNYLYHKLQSSKKLVAITQNNSTGYFIYQGRAMGFHYDLLTEYCKAHNFTLELLVEEDFIKSLKMIDQGKAEILAVDITLTKSRKKDLNLTIPHGYNHQVIVQRKPNKKNKVAFLKDVLYLEGKKVYVQKGTIFKEQLEILKEQTGINFIIIEDSARTMEELIIMVSEGKIDYTACDERPAKAQNNFLSNIDYSLIISPKQKLCWAVPPKEDSLLLSINNWLTDFKKTKKYAQLEKKYFHSNSTEHIANQDFLPGQGGKLTPYDKIIQKYAKNINWDWRLLAALIYQESRFKPETVSWGGALGLMQIMPETGKRMGVEDIMSVEGNLKAGTKYIGLISKKLAVTVPDSAERVKFVLAAYNCGLGHIVDAQSLAKKYDKNPSQWEENAATFLLLKSQSKYYHDPVVKSGFCRGQITIDFVNEILARYNHYTNLL